MRTTSRTNGLRLFVSAWLLVVLGATGAAAEPGAVPCVAGARAVDDVPFALTQLAIVGAGGTSAGGAFAIDLTAGQGLALRSSGGAFTLDAGFQAGSSTECDDGDPCTIDFCAVTNLCAHDPAGDLDGDGACSTIDCADLDPAIFPGNVESCDGLDNDCDGRVDEDGDGDGFDACADCDDADATVYPGAAEVNDGRDNQCPGDAGYGAVDETSGFSRFGYLDKDNFSWPPQAGASSYEVARSTGPTFSQDCDTVVTPSASLIDVAVPPPGGVLFYLNRPLTPNAGSWGRTSAGLERAVTCAGGLCGDGALNLFEETCDPPGQPAGASGNLCRVDCTVCGDRLVDEAWGEQCDDGNAVAGDGCAADCQTTNRFPEDVPVTGEAPK